MKGDFSRVTFDPTRHYSRILFQQGRVQLDADFNEQADIVRYRDETEALDTIGRTGGRLGDSGFAIIEPSKLTSEQRQELEKAKLQLAGATDFVISGGRYYVDGILCENESLTPYSSQPDLPEPEIVREDGLYLVYLDVWERHITAYEDSLIRETALGSPDTATRSKTVCQVKHLRVGDPGAAFNCETVQSEFEKKVPAPNGTLQARAEEADDDENACSLSPKAGYRRLENQLYRVEIHEGGKPPAAKFKWSRENGSVVARVESIGADRITIAQPGRDAVLGFAGLDWIELTDSCRDLMGKPGTLVQISEVRGRELILKAATATGSLSAGDFTDPKVRRWESAGALALTGPGPDGFLKLEDGVEIRFDPGATYARGDYWLIPARTTTGDVEWPESKADTPAALPRRGIEHHYARLALMVVQGGAAQSVTDCRSLFPPLTELTGLFYVGGDGQKSAWPRWSHPEFVTLPRPLEAGVANGRFAVKGARVKFEITGGAGRLSNGQSSYIAMTGEDGVASTQWSVAPDHALHQVTARLIGLRDQPLHVPIRFHAGVAQPDPALHVTRVESVGPSMQGLPPKVQPIVNDSVVVPVEMVGGIRIHADGEVAPESVGRPTCFVTVELPMRRVLENEKVVEAGSYQTLVLAGEAAAKENVIAWAPTDAGRNILGALPALYAREERLLMRLCLKGNFIWSAKNPTQYLDGETFGTSKAGQQFTGLRFPSGDGRTGGDFEMWFWLRICVEFPADFVPFTKVFSVAGPNDAGDFVVIGEMTAQSFERFKERVQLPAAENQRYCGPVMFSPGWAAYPYVPTEAERSGSFQNFGVPIVDPAANQPFPGNVIPRGRIPGVFGWRVRSVKQEAQFPADYVPFKKVHSVAGPDESGDYVVVGEMTAASYRKYKTQIAAARVPNERFFGRVTLAPGVSAEAYVPTEDESAGNFRAFRIPILDPAENRPFEGNVIPTDRMPGVFGWRVRALLRD